MKAINAQAALDKIIGQIFGYKNPYTLEQFYQKYAFDIRLPQKVVDVSTGEPTWTQSPSPAKFISIENAWKRDTWEQPAKPLQTIEDILSAWREVNISAAERYLESDDVAESDNIYNSEHIYRSLDITMSKHILYSDSLSGCEYLAASQHSNSSSFCVRLEDSKESSNSFSVVWSKKIVNSYFIQDCSDLYECMFCSHLSSKQYCIANMQYQEAEYRRLKDIVVRWILTI
jgi:hypothetical protein